MDAKERAELWERLLQHDELELELSRQKEGMEQVFIKKHQKVIISPLPFSSPFTTSLSYLLYYFISHLKITVVGRECRAGGRDITTEITIHEKYRYIA